MIEKPVHIISRRNKWAIVKEGAKRADSLHKHREIAFFLSRFYAAQTIVHNKDGSVAFMFPEKLCYD